MRNNHPHKNKKSRNTLIPFFFPANQFGKDFFRKSFPRFANNRKVIDLSESTVAMHIKKRKTVHSRIDYSVKCSGKFRNLV